MAPDVTAVRWCVPSDECEGWGGGRFDYATREILIDPDFPWDDKGDGLFITMAHEVGHALGLKHDDVGIMKPGWDAPWAHGPTAEEVSAARRLHAQP
jgi:hypothetical protein